MCFPHQDDSLLFLSGFFSLFNPPPASPPPPLPVYFPLVVGDICLLRCFFFFFGKCLKETKKRRKGGNLPLPLGDFTAYFSPPPFPSFLPFCVAVTASLFTTVTRRQLLMRWKGRGREISFFPFFRSVKTNGHSTTVHNELLCGPAEGEPVEGFF